MPQGRMFPVQREDVNYLAPLSNSRQLFPIRLPAAARTFSASSVV